MGPGGGKGVRGITGPTVSKVNKFKVVFFLKTFIEQLFKLSGSSGRDGPQRSSWVTGEKTLIFASFLADFVTQ